jgi:hypothetical protein
MRSYRTGKVALEKVELEKAAQEKTRRMSAGSLALRDASA